MRHTSQYFKRSGFEEWLIYFGGLGSKFTLNFVGPEASIMAKGKYAFPRRYDLRLTLEGLGKAVDVQTKVQDSAPLMRRMFGNGSQSGPICVDSETVGTCFVRNNYYEDAPAVEIRSDSRNCRVSASKADPSLVNCPLIVEGFPGAEMVLEDYYMLNRTERNLLPEEPRRRDFVGSYRQVEFFHKPFGGCLEELGALIAIVEVLVKPLFMKVEAA